MVEHAFRQHAAGGVVGAQNEDVGGHGLVLAIAQGWRLFSEVWTVEEMCVVFVTAGQTLR
jgi:hypothetical protein